MVVVLEVWRADWHAPFLYEQDSIQNLMLIKTTLTHGWPLHESMLGAPFGQELYDFPVVADDVTHLLIIKLIGVFSSNPALVMNVFFLVQFPLTSATALWALRRLGLPVWPSVVCAVIYACAPYHFYRGELHLFLAGYYAVPIGTYLVVRLLMGEPLVVRRPEGGPTRPLGWPALIGLSLFVGCSEIYYAVFTLLLMAVAIVVTLFRPDRRRLLQGAIAATAVIALTAAAAHVPSVIYAAKHGSDKEYAKARTPSDSETFGMRTVRLLLPVNNHRLEPLAKLTDRYNRDSPSDLAEGPPQALGLVMALGFLALIFIALLGVVRAGRPGGVSELLRASSAVAVIATLIGVSGGFSLVLSYYVFDFVRSWNRLSIVIAFVALVPVALGLAWLGTRIQKRSFGKPLWVALLVALTVLAVLDQTGTALVPNYKQLRAQWQNEDAFTKAVEAKLPDKAAIYIAPYSPFPELGYTQARNFLH